MNMGFVCFRRTGLDEPLLHLHAVSIAPLCPGFTLRTLHGLLSSKPGGAYGLSVWPRINPVNRRSRSITAVV